MPRVPYSPVPNEPISSQGIPSVHVDTPPAAFGANIGSAMQSAAGEINRGANELFDRALAFQQMRNESDARNISVGVGETMGNMRNDYLSKRGVEAAPALQKYQTDLQDYRTQTLDGIKNIFVKKMVDSEISNRMIRDLDYAGAHAAEETRKSYSDSAKARINLAKTDALNNWGDDVGFQRSLNTIRQENANQGAANGLTKDITDYQTYDDIAEAQRNRVYGMAITHPEQARQYYNAHKEEFGRFKVQVEEQLERQEANVGSRNIVASLTNGDYAKRVAMQEAGGNMFIGKHQPGVSTWGPFGFTSGTWSQVRKDNPNLNLPADIKTASVAQQKDALDALTASNQAYLKGHDIPVNQQTSYLAHFFGASGAVNFYRGMQADPGQPATALADPQAVANNKSIFYNPDGTPRTAKSAYIRLTARFAGPGELTRDAGASYLKDALDGAKQLAEEMNPNNPQLADNALARVRRNYEIFHSTMRQAEVNDRDYLIDHITDHGSYTNPITSHDAIDQDPVLKSYYDHLPVPMQREIDRWIDRAAKKVDTDPTPEMKVQYEILRGKIAARVPEAMTADLTEFKLTKLQMAKLKSQQLLAARALDADHTLEHAMSVTGSYRKANGIVSGSDDEMQWRGALQGLIELHRANNGGRNPDDNTILNYGTQLQEQVGGFWGLFGRPTYRPTDEFKEKFAPYWKATHNGQEPDARQLAMGYVYSLKNPNWEQELLGQRGNK